TYSVLRGFFPEDVDHGLHLARAEMRAGRTKDAYDTIAALRRLPAPAAEDPRSDLQEADLFEARAHLRGARSSASTAGTEGPAGARRARTRSHEVTCLSGLGAVHYQRGELEFAKARYEDSLAIAREIGDRHQAATANANLGGVLEQRGELSGVRDRYEQAIR